MGQRAPDSRQEEQNPGLSEDRNGGESKSEESQYHLKSVDGTAVEKTEKTEDSSGDKAAGGDG